MSLRSKFAKNSIWMAFGGASENLVQFTTFAVLARMLSVRDLGIVTFTILFVDFCRVFVNGGLQEAIIQRKEWDEAFASACFTTNILLALAVSSLFAVIGGVGLEYAFGPGIGLVAVALAAMFMLSASRSIHVAKLKREFQYRPLAVRGTIAAILSGIGAIALAFAGAGIWALIFQRLFYEFVTSVLAWRSARWMPRLCLDFSALAGTRSFATRVTLTRGLEILNLRASDFVVGLVFGASAVAIYRVGARALDVLRRLLILPIQDSAFAAFSRLENPWAIGERFTRLLAVGLFIICPLAFGTAFIAPELTVLLFGEKYAASGIVFSILSLALIPATLICISSSAFVAANDPRSAYRSSLLLVALNIGATAILAMKFGATGAAIGNLAAQTALTPYLLAKARLKMHADVSKTLASIAVPIFISASTSAAALLIQTSAQYEIGLIEAIVVKIMLWSAIYMILTAIFGKENLKKSLSELSEFLPKRVDLLIKKFVFGSV